MSDPIEVTASGTSVSVSVGSGIGPQGPAGPQGPPGPVSSVQGLTGAVTLAVTGGTVTTSGSTITLAVSAATVDWSSITGKPATFAPSAHSHVIADVTGLQTALDGKQAAGSYAAASHGHAATAITYAGGPVGNVTGATVEEALDSIDADLEDRISSSQFAASFSTGLTVTSGVVSVAFGATSTTACAGNDARLSDSRTPTAHPHGNLTNAGAIGSTPGLIVVTGAGGVLTTAATISASAVSGLGTLATQSGTFSGTSSGTNTGDQTITLIGDVTGSGTGTFAATVANNAITYAKMQNVSATDRLLGRSTSGSGVVEEIVCTSAGRALIDDADAAAQRTTLGAQKTITSGTAAPTGGSDGDIYLQYS